MVKCFWCGTVSQNDRETCQSCGRRLEWSPFLRAILRPSIGGILGAPADLQTLSSRYEPVKYSAVAR